MVDENNEAQIRQTVAVTVASYFGPHLYEIEQATGGIVSLTASTTADHPTENRQKTPEELDLLALSATLKPDRDISISGDIPQQVYGQLLRWASLLIDKAYEVAHVTPVKFEPQAKGFRAVDKQSGKPIKESCLYSDVLRAAQGHERETGRNFEIKSGVLGKFPKALAEFERLTGQAG